MRKASLLAGALLALPLSGSALAASVPTPFDPFPTGSQVDLTGYFTTPFGVTEDIVISNFELNSFTQSHPGQANNNQTFDYSATFTAQILDASTLQPVGLLIADQNTDFNVTIENRQGITTTGTFQAILNDATFTGALDGYTITSDISGATQGTVTYVNSSTAGLTVSSLFTVPGQFSIDGGFPQSAGPLVGTSQTAPGPAPGAGLAGLVALLCAGFFARTRSSLAS